MKIWTTAIADKKVGEKVKEKGICQRPNCPYCFNKPGVVLQVSHFWGRNRSSTRFCLDNLDCFCRGTHFIWEGEKQGAYRDYMIKKLGEKGYKKLEKLYYTIISRREAIIKLMKELE